MTAALIVRHRGGSAAFSDGAVQEFTQDRIRIGRGMDCDLRFDVTEDRAVSTTHAELVVDEDSVLIVDLGSRNGVFVNDVRIEGDEALRSGDVVRFGADGPRFAVEFTLPAPQTPPETIVSPERPSGDGAERKKSVGMSTLMGVVGESVERERRRNRMVMVPIVGALLAALLAVIFWPDGEPRPWRETLANANQSVYVCAMVTGGNARPFGTAWSLGEGRLATNSHVAVEFETKQAGQQFIVRSCASPPVDLRVVGVTLHPGYRRWAKLLAKYDPWVPGQGFQRGLPSAFDVAILELHPDDKDKLAPGLPIANRDDLKALNAGDGLALLGYPMEGQAGSGVNMSAPFPQLRPGTVARLTDFFVGADGYDKARLVGMNLMSAGGASGSPVFARSGKVVAINSAGDYLDVTIGGRRFKSGGAYGQRIDILQDLLEGRAQGADAATSEALEQEFVTRFRQGVADPDKFSFWLASQQLKPGETLGQPHKEPFEISTAGAAGGQLLNGFESKKAGDYIRVIVPTTEPVIPMVTTRINGVYQPNPTMRYYMLERATLAQRLKLQTRVQVLKGQVSAAPLGYVLYWYPVEK